jgi:hypothetical protein
LDKESPCSTKINFEVESELELIDASDIVLPQASPQNVNVQSGSMQSVTVPQMMQMQHGPPDPYVQQDPPGPHVQQDLPGLNVQPDPLDPHVQQDLPGLNVQPDPLDPHVQQDSLGPNVQQVQQGPPVEQGIPNSQVQPHQMSQQELSQPEHLQQELPQQMTFEILPQQATLQQTLHPELPQPELPQPELPQQELPQPELPQPEPPPPDILQPELPQPEPPPQELPQQELTQQELTQQELTQQELPQQMVFEILSLQQMLQQEQPQQIPQQEPPQQMLQQAPPQRMLQQHQTVVIKKLHVNATAYMLYDLYGKRDKNEDKSLLHDVTKKSPVVIQDDSITPLAEKNPNSKEKKVVKNKVIANLTETSFSNLLDEEIPFTYLYQLVQKLQIHKSVKTSSDQMTIPHGEKPFGITNEVQKPSDLDITIPYADKIPGNNKNSIDFGIFPLPQIPEMVLEPTKVDIIVPDGETTPPNQMVHSNIGMDNIEVNIETNLQVQDTVLTLPDGNLMQNMHNLPNLADDAPFELDSPNLLGNTYRSLPCYRAVLALLVNILLSVAPAFSIIFRGLVDIIYPTGRPPEQFYSLFISCYTNLAIYHDTLAGFIPMSKLYDKLANIDHENNGNRDFSNRIKTKWYTCLMFNLNLKRDPNTFLVNTCKMTRISQEFPMLIFSYF